MNTLLRAKVLVVSVVLASVAPLWAQSRPPAPPAPPAPTAPTAPQAPGPPPPPPGTVNLTANVTGQGRVNIGNVPCPPSLGCTAPVRNGQAITLSASPAPGWLFRGWSGGCTSSAPNCRVTPKGALTATATFGRPVLRLVKTGSGARLGLVTATRQRPGAPASTTEFLPGERVECGLGCDVREQAFDVGSEVTISFTSQKKAFLQPVQGCSMNAGGTPDGGACRVTLRNDMTISSDFRLPTLTVSRVGPGSAVGLVRSIEGASLACGDPGGACGADVPRGTVVELTASSPSADFVQFRNGATTTASPIYRVQVTDDTLVQAQFGLAMARLTLLVTGGTGAVRVTVAATTTLTCERTAAPDRPVTECSVRLPIGSTVTVSGPPMLPPLQTSGACGTTTFRLSGDGTCRVNLP